jgi:tripartite-type tricarboxylate transporter receptor subunit TctC
MSKANSRLVASVRDASAMKLPHRRQLLHLAAGVAALPAMSRAAWAQAYPSRPVRIIVAVAAGGTSDILADFAKLIADETEKWGKVVKFANIKAE